MFQFFYFRLSDYQPSSAEKAQHYLKNGDPWQMHGLGIILLSGLERSILRLRCPESMKQFCQRITAKHGKMNVSPNDMANAMLVVEPVIIEAVKKWDQHGTHVMNKDNCQLCHAWRKMFQYVAAMLRTDGEAVNQSNNPVVGIRRCSLSFPLLSSQQQKMEMPMNNFI